MKEILKIKWYMTAFVK